MYKTLSSVAICLAIAVQALPGIANSQPGATAPSGKSSLSVCDLLSDQNIASVQGERVSERKASSTPTGGLAVSHCYFALTTPSKSISLSVTERAQGEQGQDPRRYWKATFERKKDKGKDRDKDRNRDGDEDENAAAPTRIAGLAEAAYWAGSPIGGTLYVLKGHRFLSISVGGPDDQAEKIRKSKALARFALKRF